MKKLVVIGLMVLVLGLLVGGLTTPLFAHGLGDGVSAGEGAWEAMHEACEEGDWEAMIEAAEEVHGDDFAAMPCHGEAGYAPANRWGETGGHMGSGMMGW